MDYLPVEYCFDRSFQFLIPSRDDWALDMSSCMYIYTDGCKLVSGVDGRVYSRKVNLNISLRLS